MPQIQKISFTSTYRIPLSEHRITPHKKEMVKEFADQYPNHLHRSNRLGWVRISVPEFLDEEIEKGLKSLGFKIYQKFGEHDVNREEMDKYIKHELDARNYKQFGKQKKKAKFKKRKVA